MSILKKVLDQPPNFIDRKISIRRKYVEEESLKVTATVIEQPESAK